MKEQKTTVAAPANQQEIIITRQFDLPVDLLFQAYTDAEIVAVWMGTTVVQLENKHGGIFRFETTDPMGNVHVFEGVMHEFIPSEKITRTFKMVNTQFEVQLEYLHFSAIDDDTSTLNMHIVFRSIEQRDALLKLPFAMGINMAHARLEAFVKQLKK
jgi:uncharacterized protein YndB with AHSA1/START domain